MLFFPANFLWPFWKAIKKEGMVPHRLVPRFMLPFVPHLPCWDNRCLLRAILELPNLREEVPIHNFPVFSFMAFLCPPQSFASALHFVRRMHFDKAPKSLFTLQRMR